MFEEIQSALRARSLKLLYVAPERFANERFLAQLKTLRIDLLVIDEAHCISEWGHNFRPDYLKLARYAEALNVGRVLTLTATATPAVARDICRAFSIAPEAHVHTGFYRPNLFLRVTACASPERISVLIERLRARSLGPTIVYVTLQKTAETVAAALAAAGFAAAAYHAGMEAEVREAVQNRFMAADDAIVVATIAFGMGIDKPDVRFVAHLDLPKNIEGYYQETGRGGRDGLPATAWLAYGLQDVVQQRRMIDESPGDDSYKRRLGQQLDAMLGLCETVTCRRVRLLNYFGQTIAPCGNCDVCLDPPEAWDGTVAAQKVLSAVYRLWRERGQRYGAGHIIDVLRGKATDSDMVLPTSLVTRSTTGPVPS